MNALARTAIVVAALFASIGCRAAQNGFAEGHVIDKDGRPAAGALISIDRVDIPGLHFETKTDTSGRYSITILPFGEYLFSLIENSKPRMRLMRRIGASDPTLGNTNNSVNFDLRKAPKEGQGDAIFDGVKPETRSRAANNDTEALRQSDVYAIYSTMMATSLAAYESSDSRYAIAATTKPPMRDYPCIVPPPQYTTRWAEVLADFKARIDKPTALVSQLTLSKPYIFISADEVAAFQAARMGSPPLRSRATRPAPPLDPKFQSQRHIFFLSDVYFNKDHTLALTGIANWCGGLCASRGWKIYEKNAAGRWVDVRPDKDCREFS